MPPERQTALVTASSADQDTATGAEIIPFPSRTGTGAGTRIDRGSIFISFDARDVEAAPVFSLDEIYPPVETVGGGSALTIVLGSLAECLDHATEALRAFRAGDLVAADDEMHNVHADLAGLFQERHRVGEGFASAINSLQVAIHSRRGEPLDEKQIIAIRSVIRGLQGRPFLSFEDSLEFDEELELVGLKATLDNLDVLDSGGDHAP